MQPHKHAPDEFVYVEIITANLHSAEFASHTNWKYCIYQCRVHFFFVLVSLLLDGWKVMVVSSGFLDHAAEVYLRTNGLIMSAQSPITSLNVNRTATEWSQSQPPQSTASNTPQVSTNFIAPSKVHRSIQLN